MDINELNQLIWSMGLKFRAEIFHRPPVAPHFPLYDQALTLATTQLFLCLPEAVRRTLKRTSPEELAQRGKSLGSSVSPLAMWLFGYYFLIGREVLIDRGQIAANAHTEDIALVLDFWRRLTFAYREDGRLDNSDAGATNTFLPPETLHDMYNALIPVDAIMQPRLQQFLATLEPYLLQVHAGTQVGKADSGPYPLHVERVLIVRDCCDLKGVYYPWHDYVADVPFQTCTLAMTFDAEDFQTLELNDESVLRATPAAYQSYIREVAFLAGKGGPSRALPITEMDWLTRSMKKASTKLDTWFPRRQRREQILAQALPWVVAPFALLSSAEGYRGRDFAPHVLQLLSAYEDDDTMAARWYTHRCLAPGSVSAFVPVM